MTSPAVPEPDDKDWTWVLERACPQCGFDARAVAADQIGSQALTAVAALRAALDRDDASERREPKVWSTLEYGCHVRDVCLIFYDRLHLLLDHDDPQFENWDQDATAVENGYWTQEPRAVSGQLDAAAQRIALAFDAVEGDQWQRRGRRSNGSVFTVLTLGRYFVHDLVHHVHDVTPQ